MKLRKTLFTNAREVLIGEEERTYEFLKFIGNKLPENFDEDDLAYVVHEFINELSTNPERLPNWMQEDISKTAMLCSKIKALLLTKQSQESELFTKAYERLVKRHNEAGA